MSDKSKDLFIIKLIKFALSLSMFVINIYILHRINKIKKNSEACPCAFTSNAKNIKVSIILLIVIIIFYSILSIFFTNNKLFHLTNIIYTIINIYFGNLLMKYSRELKDNNCDCISKKFKSNINSYGIFNIVFGSISIAYVLLSFIFFVRMVIGEK